MFEETAQLIVLRHLDGLGRRRGKRWRPGRRRAAIGEGKLDRQPDGHVLLRCPNAGSEGAELGASTDHRSRGDY
jgi:hypothetical protein